MRLRDRLLQRNKLQNEPHIKNHLDHEKRITALEGGSGGSSGSATVDKETLKPIIEEIIDELLAEEDDDSGSLGTPREVHITVRNIDQGGTPVSGAEVTIGNVTRTTGSAGGCNFSLTDGTYEVSLSSSEPNIQATRSITVTEQDTNFELDINS